MRLRDVGYQNITWQESNNVTRFVNNAIGLSSWSTSVTYDNIKVTDALGQIIYTTDFSDAEEYQQRWNATGGTWDINGGALNQTNTSMQGKCNVCQIPCGENYTLELDATKNSGNEGFLIAFSYDDPNNFIWWNLGGWNNSQHAIEQCVGGSKRTLTKLAGSLRQGQTYHLRIVKEGYDIYCYLDNTLYHHITLPASRGVYACASLNQAEDSLILKLVNLGETQEALLRFKDFRWTGQIEQQVLTSNSGSDENSMTALNKVKPVESVFVPDTGDNTSFSYSVPSHSLCILRIPVTDVTPEQKPEPSEDDWEDITDQLHNASFSEGRDGWTGTPFLAAPGTVAEFYNQNFDAYQNLSDMPAGDYRFTINGFYRYGSKDNAWVAHNNGTEGLNALLYIQTGEETRQTPFMSIFDSTAPFTYSPDYTYPDNVTQANVALNLKGAYQQNAVEIALDNDGGELRVGMKKTVATTNDWTCFDNARLYFRKKTDTDGIKSITPSTPIGNGTAYDLSGRKNSRSAGVRIIKSGTKSIKIINK